MSYIITIFITILLIHFILYYLNIDPYKLSNNTNNIVNDKNNISNVESINNDNIVESINELKKLNQYIDNECKCDAICKTI